MQHKFGYSFNSFLQKLYMSQFQIYYLIFKLYTPNQFISFFMAIIENFQILSLFLTNDVEYIFFNIIQLVYIWKKSRTLDILSTFLINFRIEQYFTRNWKLFFIFLYLCYVFIFLNFLIYVTLSFKSYKNKTIKDNKFLLLFFRATTSCLNGIFYFPFLGK